MARVRTFIGIELDEVIREEIATLQAELTLTGANVKWVERANLHVTLLFLGEVEERELYSVSRIVTAAARSEPSFRLGVSGVGAFPNLRRPKIAWAGLSEGVEVLKRLHSAMETPLLDLGCYRQEERGYTPHVTLGRTQGEADSHILAEVLPKYATWPGGETTVEEVVVFSSELRRSGPEYAVLARSPLTG